MKIFLKGMCVMQADLKISEVLKGSVCVLSAFKKRILVHTKIPSTH